MEIKLQKGVKCRINYVDCPCCGIPFNAKARKKTWHHAVPLFLKPETEIEVSICWECHEKLNATYVHTKVKAINLVGKNQPKSFGEFLENYKVLKNDFLEKTKGKTRTVNGKFGEGLWLNLINYLEYLDSVIMPQEKI